MQQTSLRDIAAFFYLCDQFLCTHFFIICRTALSHIHIITVRHTYCN